MKHKMPARAKGTRISRPSTSVAVISAVAIKAAESVRIEFATRGMEASSEVFPRTSWQALLFRVRKAADGSPTRNGRAALLWRGGTVNQSGLFKEKRYEGLSA